MKYLTVVADDFGFTPGVVDGCIESVNEGILMDLSLMMNSPGTMYGIKQAQQHGISDLGIHITLMDINGTGRYLRTGDYKQLLEQTPRRELENMVKDELKSFEDAVGAIPTHINAHQNCIAHEKTIDAVAEYALEHDLYIRRFKSFAGSNPGAGGDILDKIISQGVKTSDHIYEQIEGSYEQAKSGFIENLALPKKESTTEIFFHPAYLDDTLRQYTSLLEERERDVKLLTEDDFSDKILDLGFELTSYSQLG